MIQYDIIKRPLMTEKTTLQKETFNQLSFEVDRRANRVEIKRAIEKIFSVRVATVRTIQVKGKTKLKNVIITGLGDFPQDGGPLPEPQEVLDDTGEAHIR